jgi:hypothetical protein
MTAADILHKHLSRVITLLAFSTSFPASMHSPASCVGVISISSAPRPCIAIERTIRLTASGDMTPESGALGSGPCLFPARA